jgi:AraC family transcriptional regulator
VDTRKHLLIGIDYIEEHLDEPIRLVEVAARAGLSPFYFSRLFRVLTGEPFGAYVRLRRLTLAAQRLAAEGRSLHLIDLSFDTGYESQEAFTRAFKRAFGCTPGAYRMDPSARDFRGRSRFDGNTLAHLEEAISTEPEITEIDPFTVVGVRESFDRDNRHQVPELWDHFIELQPEVLNAREDATYGVCLNGKEDGSFDYLAGVAVSRVDALKQGLVAETIPRQVYAVFTHVVRSAPFHDDLQPTVRWIWGTWLPNSAYEYAPGPDFERYPRDFDPTHIGASLEVCVPVRVRP